MPHNNLNSIIDRILEDPEYTLPYEDACAFAEPGDNVIDLLMHANQIRDQYKGDRVFTCSIINAKSGRCSEDCAFCAQSAHHQTGVNVYPLLNVTDMVETALHMQDAGATKYSIVTSGFMLTDNELDIVLDTTEKIRKETNLAICASLGALTKSMASQLRESGVSTYHHNLETARSHFDHICTTHNYDDDLETLKFAKEADFRVCSGGIFGLGETWRQRIELAYTLKQADIDSIPINFLNPIPGTPMENMPLLPPLEALKCIALFRIIHPEKDISICGGRERTLRDYQSWIFLAGANGLMIGDYLTTEGRNASIDAQMIEDMGLQLEERS